MLLSCSNDKSVHIWMRKIIFTSGWSRHLKFHLFLFFLWRWRWKMLIIVSWMLWVFIIIKREATTNLIMLCWIFGVNTTHLLLLSCLIEWWIDLGVVQCHSIILLVYLIHNFTWVSSLIAIFFSLRLIFLVLTLILFLEFALECKECYESKAESAFHHRTIHVKQS